MTITMQGTWLVSVSSKDASWAQRFIIDGSSTGDGTYTGATATPAVLVTGEQWGLTVEHDPSGPTGWRRSRERLGNFRVEGGLFKVDVESDDGGGVLGTDDADFDDLVLTLAKPLSASDWIVYGRARSYSGYCLFNPCFPHPWVVVDTAAQLDQLLQYGQVRAVLERATGRDLSRRADGDAFVPLMLSRGGLTRGGFDVAGSTVVDDGDDPGSDGKELSTDVVAELTPHVSTVHSAHLTKDDLAVLGPLLRRPCESEPIAQSLLRFVEYDRTEDELGGAPHTGFGGRETLGVTATDEFGNYVFSFTRTAAQIVGEAVTDTPIGGDPTVSGRPDLIIQFVDEPDAVAVHETAPYYDIPNVRRIDLCVRAEHLQPKPCRGDRTIQYLGDIPIVNNPGSTLHPDGTVTNGAASESGPTITRGAWRGVVDIRGCFEDAASPVTHYTIRYQVGGGAWNWLAVEARGLRAQTSGTWVSESYGPTTTALGGGMVPAYRNIEDEPGWSLEVEHRKARVNLASLLAGLPTRVAPVVFQIRGYDSSGTYVPGTFDQVRLLVDDVAPDGEIASVLVPGESDLGDCALLDLPSDTTPLEFQLRAVDEHGFLAAWSLSATRGSNTPVGLTDTGTGSPPGGSFPGPDPNTHRYHGTTERTGADPTGLVSITVTPPVTGWLGAEDFCAYSFELHLRARTTNGKTVASSHRVWDEVVGMRAASSP